MVVLDKPVAPARRAIDCPVRWRNAHEHRGLMAKMVVIGQLA